MTDPSNNSALDRVEQLLQQFELFGVNLGLEASQTLLAALNHPQNQVPIVHVAGSNGKGSVCAYLSSVLTEAGYKVGRYTSPHLIDWCERICINQQPITPDDLYRVLQKVEAAIDRDRPSPTQFEVITAAMWLYFAEQKVDIAVIEVGLGGRLDATNVVDRPLASIITSISKEHWQRLGDTLGKIATEKAGILKPHCPSIVALDTIPAEAATVIAQRMKDLQCTWISPIAGQIKPNGTATFQGYQLTDYAHQIADTDFIASIAYQPPLPGETQRQNAALAIATLLHLSQNGWKIPIESLISGIENTTWTGRLQWYVWNKTRFLIDGAHNPDSARVLREYVNSLDRTSIHWVMGMLTPKDHREVFEELLCPGDSLHLVPVPGHSSAKPEDLAAIAQSVCPTLSACRTYSNVFEGLEIALANSNLTVLCGSLYLIGDFLSKTRSI